MAGPLLHSIAVKIRESQHLRQAVAIAKALEPREREAAKERQKSGGKAGGKACGKLPQASGSKTLWESFPK